MFERVSNGGASASAVVSTRGRIEGLDVLRGLAAVAVVLHHHTQYYDVLYPGRERLPFDFGAGHFGVELFFIISGYVILMTIERKKSLYDFVASRIARLVPTFWAAAAITGVMLYIHPMPPLIAPPLEMIVANLTMAPSLFSVPGIDLPYWTLTYELVFYAGIATLFATGLLRHMEIVCLVWLAFDAFVLLTGMPLFQRLAIVLLIGYGNFFIAGMCLYRICWGRATALTYFLLPCCIAITLVGGGEKAFHTPGPLYFAVTLGAASLVWIAARYNPRWMNVGPLLFLGRISYPLYLIHSALGYELIRLVQEAGGSTIAGIALAVTCSVLLATILHLFIENPGKRFLRTFFAIQRKRFLSAAPAPASGD
jgi:peptidoglycan/LPS O-acetylase OafA/YrhL